MKLGNIWLQSFLITLVSLVVTCQTVFALDFNDLKDLKDNYWAKNFIEFLTKKNVVTGYPDNTFRPEHAVTRAEFAVMLAKSKNLDISGGSNRLFVDVPTNYWAYPSIQAVAKKGWIKGYSNGRFMPNQMISTTEMYAIIAQADDQSMVSSDSEINKILSNFQDSGQIPSWARSAVATAVKNNVHVSEISSNQLFPGIPASRASVATSLAKLLNPALRGDAVITQQQEQSVQLYFPNRLDFVNNTLGTGTLLEPVSRTLQSVNLPEASIREILAGPTIEERNRGFFLDEEIARLDLDSVNIDAVGRTRVLLKAPTHFEFSNSGAAKRLDDQLTRTLQQFTGVRQVDISIRNPNNQIIWTSP